MPPVALDAEAMAPPRRLPVVPVVVALAVFLGMAYAVASWFDPQPPSTASVGDGQSNEEAPATGAMETVPSERASSPGRRRSTPSRTAPVAARDASAPSATPGGRVAPAPGPTPTTGRVDVVVAEGAGRVLPSTVPGDLDRRIPKGSLYTSADTSVLPPILIRPLLSDRPSPDVPDEQIGTLEFIVTESGTVEHVRLISPANRYQHRMLVAAAKTWQFQPATRDGRPVRFQTRIRLLL